jgi:hypothetical protein
MGSGRIHLELANGTNGQHIQVVTLAQVEIPQGAAQKAQGHLDLLNDTYEGHANAVETYQWDEIECFEIENAYAEDEEANEEEEDITRKIQKRMKI